MQRKRRNVNFGNFSKSPGKYQKKFTNSITKLTLHSIPAVRMSESNKKSNARIKLCPICGKEDIYQPTSVVWWRSPNRIPSLRFGAVIRTRASQVVMTPLSRLGRYLKIPAYIMCILLLSFVVSDMMSGFNGECYAAVNPTASLSVSNPTLSTTIAPGDTAYLSSNVTYSASDIDSYTLQVSYANGYNSLKLDGGTTTLTGANGAKGLVLADNSWGFAWTSNMENKVSSNSVLKYYTMPAYGTSGSNLSTGRLESASNLTSVGNTTLSSTTKRIVFAAKFAENNTNSGHYKTGVQLSMVATPRKLTLADINNMQDVTPNICTNTSTGTTYTLKDTRDNNSYTVRKFADGRCWMTSNLLLKGSRTLTSADSDVTSSYILPAPITSLSSTDFSDSNYYVAQSYNTSSANSGNTVYYSWTAATAGAGASSSLSSGNASTSICPRGWKLPSGDTDGEYRALALSESLYNEAGTIKIQDLPYNFKHTGFVRDGRFSLGSSYGFWWSSTVSSAEYAYYMEIKDGDVPHPGTVIDSRYRGFAVRCIARN